MHQPRFAPAVRTEVMPGQPRSGTAGAVERFILWAPWQLRERLLPGTATTRVRIPQRRRHRSATVRLRRQTRVLAAYVTHARKAAGTARRGLRGRRPAHVLDTRKVREWARAMP